MKNRFWAVALVSVIGILAGVGLVSAATSFLGQGPIKFDAISVGQKGKPGSIQLNGTFANRMKGAGNTDKPVTIGDHLRIDGLIWRGATQGASDGKPVIVDDNIEVKGDVTFKTSTGTRRLGEWNDSDATAWTANTNRWNENNGLWTTNTSLWSTNTSLWNLQTTDNADNDSDIAALSNMFDCVGDFAEISIYLESEDFIFCWNAWMAGHAFPASRAVVPPAEGLSVDALSKEMSLREDVMLERRASRTGE